MILGFSLSYLYTLIVEDYVYEKVSYDLQYKNVKGHFNKEMMKIIILSLIPMVNMIFAMDLMVNYFSSDRKFIAKLKELGIIDYDDGENEVSFTEDEKKMAKKIKELSNNQDDIPKRDSNNKLDYSNVTIVSPQLVRKRVRKK